MRPIPTVMTILAGTLLVLAAPALARRPIPSVVSEPTPAPAFAPASKAVHAWFSRLDVHAPRVHKGMKVFPLTARDDFDLSGTLTLDEALKAKALVVTELEGGARVNELRLENVGSQPVFVMAGEIMRGAKQDRTLQSDLLVPPKSGPLTVAAFCTEQGRWNEQSAGFMAADQAVPNSVRGVVKGAPVQGRVWDSIAENQAKLRVSAPTSAAKQVYEEPKVQADIKPYVAAFEDLPRSRRGTVGVAVTYGERLVAVDVFGDDALFARLYPKLLRSYVVDVVADAWRGDRGEADVRRWLATARDAKWTQGRTDGIGVGLAWRVGKLHGTSLVEPPRVLHADVFEGEPAPPNARPEPQIMRPTDRNRLTPNLQNQAPVQAPR